MKDTGASRRREAGEFKLLEGRGRHGRNPGPIRHALRSRPRRLAPALIRRVVLELNGEPIQGERRERLVIDRLAESMRRRMSHHVLAQSGGAPGEDRMRCHAVLLAHGPGWFPATAKGQFDIPSHPLRQASSGGVESAVAARGGRVGGVDCGGRTPLWLHLPTIRRAWLHSPCSQSGNLFPQSIPPTVLPATSDLTLPLEKPLAPRSQTRYKSPREFPDGIRTEHGCPARAGS